MRERETKREGDKEGEREPALPCTLLDASSCKHPRQYGSIQDLDIGHERFGLATLHRPRPPVQGSLLLRRFALHDIWAPRHKARQGWRRQRRGAARGPCARAARRCLHHPLPRQLPSTTPSLPCHVTVQHVAIPSSNPRLLGLPGVAWVACLDTAWAC